MNYKVFYGLQIICILVLSLAWLFSFFESPATASATIDPPLPHIRLTGAAAPSAPLTGSNTPMATRSTGVGSSDQPTSPLAESISEASLTRHAVDVVTDAQVTGYPDSRKIVRDSRDNLYVAYRKKSTDGKFHTFVAALPSGGRQFINTEMSIESILVPETQRVPSLTIDENDVLHVVWYGPDRTSQSPNERQIRYTRAPAQAADPLAWEPVRSPAGRIDGYELLARTPNISSAMWQEHPVIFAAGDQTLYIAWEGRDRNHLTAAQIKWSRSLDGGETWSRWQNIPGEPGVYYSRPTLIASADGRQLYVLAYATDAAKVAQLVWTQSLDGDTRPGDRWAPWQYVTDGDGDGANDTAQDQRHLSVAVDSRGDLHLVWQQRADHASASAPPQIHYAFYSGGQGWRPAQLILPTDDAEQTFPSITVDKDDRLWVAWSERSHAVSQPATAPTVGEIRVAKKPVRSQWQAIRTPIVSQGGAAFYPTFRWHRFGVAHGVDLVWVESAVTRPLNVECVAAYAPACTIYYANLAGQ